MKRLVLLLCLLSLLPLRAHAHVGNKNIFQEVSAGPYRLFVTVRPPDVIPGVAVIEVRTDSPVSSLAIAPIPLTGEASHHMPTPDAMKPMPGLPGSYSGSLWLMAPGSWQVHFDVDGANGKATAAVPVPAVALRIMHMNRGLGWLLAGLGLVLVLGLSGIIAAAVGEASVPPGETPGRTRYRRAAVAGGISLLLLLAFAGLGDRWWNVEAANYAEGLYRPLKMHATLTAPGTLHLVLGSDESDADTVHGHGPSDLLTDHGKLMHLYAIREPGMDAVFHLHPTMTGDWHFTDALPAMPPGTYRLFADIVHRNGFPETLTTTMTVPPGESTRALAYDDAEATPPAIDTAHPLGPRYRLPDGYTMVWDRPATLTANTGYSFRFTLLAPGGQPATDAETYLGMAGHAAFVRDDFGTFAHTHPDGMAAMPAVMIAEGAAPASLMPGAAMPGMSMSTAPQPIPPTVEFPYGFPGPGRYRIFIQMRHGTAGTPGTVETGVFDASVQ